MRTQLDSYPIYKRPYVGISLYAINITHTHAATATADTAAPFLKPVWLRQQQGTAGFQHYLQLQPPLTLESNLLVRMLALQGTTFNINLKPTHADLYAIVWLNHTQAIIGRAMQTRVIPNSPSH